MTRAERGAGRPGGGGPARAGAAASAPPLLRRPAPRGSARLLLGRHRRPGEPRAPVRGPSRRDLGLQRSLFVERLSQSFGPAPRRRWRPILSGAPRVRLAYPVGPAPQRWRGRRRRDRFERARAALAPRTEPCIPPADHRVVGSSSNPTHRGEHSLALGPHKPHRGIAVLDAFRWTLRRAPPLT